MSSKLIKKFSFFGAGALSVILTTAQAANQNCISCDLLARQQQSGNTAVTPAILEAGIDVGSILQRSSLIRFPSLVQAAAVNSGASSATTATLASASTPTWDGLGPIPGAFKRGFEWAPTDFNPTFRTDFYSEATGVVNTSSAPWNMYLPPELARIWYGPIMAMPQPPVAAVQGQSTSMTLAPRF